MRKALTLIVYYIYMVLFVFPTLLAATVVTAILTIVGTLIGPAEFWANRPAVLWSKLMCMLCWVKVDVRGRENIDKSTSYVFVANHQGAFDIFSVFAYLGHNFKWMMKKSLGKILLVGTACRRAGHIFVDRSSASAVRHTIETAEARLRDGMSIVVFPEGARTFNGHMGPFKKGAYQLALEFHLPIVPITIDGSFDVMPRTTIIPRPGHIIITIHKPIAAPQSEADRTEVMNATRAAIASALPANRR